MLCRLAAEESAYLSEHFRLLEKVDSEEKIPLIQLKDPKFLQSFLGELQGELETESMVAAASQFMKRIGYLMVVPSLYAVAVFDKALNLDFAKGYLVNLRHENLWMPQLFWEDLTAVDLIGESRSTEFENFVSDLFGVLSEMIRAVSAAASIPRSILWENVAIYVYWLYENRLVLEKDNAVRLQAQRDFKFILNELPAEVFGEKANPLQKFHNQKNFDPESGEAVRIRQTCCFAYETGAKKGYCKTCPKKGKNIPK